MHLVGRSHTYEELFSMYFIISLLSILFLHLKNYRVFNLKVDR